MAWQRIRTIKPSFFQNEDLAGLPALARLLFIGLWTVADREGRLEDRPRRLKAQLLPYDEADVDALLSSLASAGFIHRYTADGSDYIEIGNFAKHQRPHPRESPSEIPKAPPRPALGKPRLVLGESKDIPEHNLGERRSQEENQEEKENQEETHTGLSPSEWGFPDFWSAYPKKRHKPDAQKAWRQIGADRQPCPIRDGLERWKGSDAWRRGFVEDPSTFLRQRQWEDEPAAARDDLETAHNLREIKRGLDLVGRARGWNP